MWNPQFKLLGNYPSPCAVILEIISVSAWNTISESSCTGDNSLTDSSYEYGVWIAVERNDGFKRFSSMWKQPTLSGSRLEFVASSFVTVEASLSRKPELGLRRTPYIIVRKVQQVFDENDFVDVNRFVNRFSGRFLSGKKPRWWVRRCVSVNISAILRQLRIWIHHGNRRRRRRHRRRLCPSQRTYVNFLLGLIVARKGEWSVKVESHIFCLFEKARGPDHRRLYIHELFELWTSLNYLKLVPQNLSQFHSILRRCFVHAWCCFWSLLNFVRHFGGLFRSTFIRPSFFHRFPEFFVPFLSGTFCGLFDHLCRTLFKRFFDGHEGVSCHTRPFVFAARATSALV